MLTKPNVTVYQCEHCKNKMFRKHAMELHEKWCTKNPDNFMKCIGCENLEIKTFQFMGYDGFVNAKCFSCKAKNVEMYPFSALKKNLPTKYPYDFEDKILMPKECDLYKFDLPF